MKLSRHDVAILVAIPLSLSCQGQRLLRSHLIQPSGGDTRCAIVVRPFETFDDPDVTVFRLTTSKRMVPGDYHVGYFIDTGYVHAEWIHVSHTWSVMDQWLVVGDVPVTELRFGKPDGRHVTINVHDQ